MRNLDQRQINSSTKCLKGNHHRGVDREGRREERERKTGARKKERERSGEREGS